MTFLSTKRVSVSALAVAAALVGAPAFAAGSGPACGLANGQTATGAPIEIGAVVGKTGPADFSASARSAKAYFDCVNANGGVNGRRINYTIADDGWKPEQASQVATQLVKDRKVVALVGNSSFIDCAVNAALYDAENVLAVAGEGVSRECYFSKNIATLGQGPRLSVLGGAIHMAQKFGVKHAVCIAGNIAGIGQWSCGGMEDWGKAHGLKVDIVLVDLRSVDATSILLQAMSFKPDAMVTDLPMEAAVAIYAAAEQQDLGDKYKWFGPSSLYDESFPKAVGPYWNNRIFVEQELQPIDARTGDNQNWLAVLDKYGAKSDRRDTFSQGGYLAARVATETLLKLDPAKIDRASVTEAFRGIKGFKSDILCGSWYFGLGSTHAANHAGSVAVVSDGGFKPQANCIAIDDPEIAESVKQETALGLAQ
jgi:branched-chain amino acid transport system substrate-binding protein